MDVTDQVRAARDSYLAVRSPNQAVLTIQGNDRLSWLNGLITCDLMKRGVDEVAYGLFVGRNGRVLADAHVLGDEARLFAVVPRAAMDALLRHLQHYLVMEDAEVAPTDELEAWAVHGSRSAEALAAATALGAVGGLVDSTGLGGALFVAGRDSALSIRDALGRSASPSGSGVVGDDNGWQALRLERAVPEFGRDFDEKTYPQEAGLEGRAVSFAKGCYLGQEVVCMLEMRGHVKRKIAALDIEGGETPARGTPVLAGMASGAEVVGEVTSAALSPTLARPVALGMIKRAYTQSGAELFVSGARARVVERPA
jgi:folate-binding protein YgfZ